MLEAFAPLISLPGFAPTESFRPVATYVLLNAFKRKETREEWVYIVALLIVKVFDGYTRVTVRRSDD